MLNVFPSLLVYSFFAPTILRVVAAAIILTMAHIHRVRRDEIIKLFTPILGNLATYILWVVVAVEAAVGFGLFIGLYTQVAALIGIILAIRSLVARPQALSPFDRTTDWLLLAVCVSLVFTGAGALAFDIPL